MKKYLNNQRLMKNAFTAGKEFYKSDFKPQIFSLPNTIMKYLWKHPSRPAGYQKLIQTCKFFFAKNPILICLSRFCYSGFTEIQYWDYCTKCHNCFDNRIYCYKKEIIFEKINCKFWLLGHLDIRRHNFPQNFLPMLYRSNAKYVSLLSDINYLNHIRLFASSAIKLSLAGCILDKNGQQILIENFIEYFPLLQEFCIYWNKKNITPCKNYEKVLTLLQKLPSFKKFMFKTLPENFNIQTYIDCVKHLKIQFETQLYYSNESSEAEIENRLEEIIYEIRKIKYFDYCPTLIWSYTLRKQKGHLFFPLEEKIEKYHKEKHGKL